MMLTLRKVQRILMLFLENEVTKLVFIFEYIFALTSIIFSSSSLSIRAGESADLIKV